MAAYYKENWAYVLVLFSSAYLYKQSFMIPGSVLLVLQKLVGYLVPVKLCNRTFDIICFMQNVLGGALFDLHIAFPLVSILTGVGASCCFLLAQNFGKDFIQRKFPNKISWLQHQV
jgi:hypothetical protein